MNLRPARLLACLVVAAFALLGAGVATAAPADPPSPTEPVPARCGQTVRAEPGQQVRVTPALGLPFLVPVEAGMDPIRRSVAGVLCRVNVDVVEPVAGAAAQAAPPLRPVTGAAARVVGDAEQAVDPEPAAAAEAAEAAAPTSAPPAPPAPRLSGEQAAAAAPAFASAFGELPASFLRSAAGPAPGVRMDAASLLGSAFPGLRAGAPAYLGYEPASAVTTASQVQALPLDALADGGVGVPALLAVLGLSGVAALLVRRIAFGRVRPAAPARAVTASAPVDEARGEQGRAVRSDLTGARRVVL